MELLHEGKQLEGIVTFRKCNADGNLIGIHNPNPLLNSRQYVFILVMGITENMPRINKLTMTAHPIFYLKVS